MQPHHGQTSQTLPYTTARQKVHVFHQHTSRRHRPAPTSLAHVAPPPPQGPLRGASTAVPQVPQAAPRLPRHPNSPKLVALKQQLSTLLAAGLPCPAPSQDPPLNSISLQISTDAANPDTQPGHTSSQQELLAIASHTSQAASAAEQAAATLKQLSILWAEYTNTKAQLLASRHQTQRQRLAANKARRHMLTQLRLRQEPSLAQQVAAVGLQLAHAAHKGVMHEPTSSPHACNFMMGVVHAMGGLAAYDVQLLSAAEQRVLAVAGSPQFAFPPAASAGAGGQQEGLGLRPAAQLIAVWARLGWRPRVDTMQALLACTATGMDAACHAATAQQALSAPTADPAAVQQLPGKQHTSGGAGDRPLAGTAQRRVAGSSQRRAATGTVRLQATARALVDLAEALAALLSRSPHAPTGQALPQLSGPLPSTGGELTATPLPLLLPHPAPAGAATAAHDPLMAWLVSGGMAPLAPLHPLGPSPTAGSPSQPSLPCPLPPLDPSWQHSFLTCSAAHLPALRLAGLTSLLTACAALQLAPDPPWTATAAQALAAELGPRPTTTGADSAVQALGMPEAAEQGSCSALQAAVPALEALAWMHARSQRRQGQVWLAADQPAGVPDTLQDQVWSVLLAPASLRQCSPRLLTPLLWSALTLGPARRQQNSSRSSSSPGAAAWQQAALEQLHGQLAQLPARQVAQALHVAALMRVRPYKGWMMQMNHQVQRHHASLDRDSALMVVWSLAALHASGLPPPDPPTTSALVSALSRHLGQLGAWELQVVDHSLTLLYRRMTGRPLQRLMRGIRARMAGAGWGSAFDH